MAGGGVFTTHNKVLPGAYINFISKARAIGTIGERGTVIMPWYGDFGKTGEIIQLDSESFQKDCSKIIGYSYTDDEVLPLREVFKGAKIVKLFRADTGQKASAKIGNITATALYKGERGNKITVSISKDVDGNSYTVETYLDGSLKDTQSIAKSSELIDNDYVEFSGSGEITVSAGVTLTGGQNGDFSGDDYEKFLSLAESEDFTTIIYPKDDNTTKSLFAQFTKRLRQEEGYKVTCVLHDFDANFEGVLNVVTKCVPRGDVLANGLVYWVAGMTASANVNESLTNKLYDGELDLIVDNKKSQLSDYIQSGKFAFYGDKNGFRVLKDINSFTEVSTDKNKDFQSNQVIRVLDAIANDTAKIFNDYYLGKCQNNSVGRDIFKTELVTYHQKLMALGAIENFLPEHITVFQGDEKGDVVVNEVVEVIGCMDKLYMSCVVA